MFCTQMLWRSQMTICKSLLRNVPTCTDVFDGNYKILLNTYICGFLLPTRKTRNVCACIRNAFVNLLLICVWIFERAHICSSFCMHVNPCKMKILLSREPFRCKSLNTFVISSVCI